MTTSIHCFAIPALHPEPAQSELNLFLAQQRVLALRREFIADGANSCWVFCVELADGQGPLPTALRVPGSRAPGGAPGGGPGRDRTGAVDYKQLLSEADFMVYAALRELRKQQAQAEGVPVFAVFSNEQMAAIVTQGVHNAATLAAIEGIGPARLEKYGAAVLACLQAQRAGPVPTQQPLAPSLPMPP